GSSFPLCKPAETRVLPSGAKPRTSEYPQGRTSNQSPFLARLTRFFPVVKSQRCTELSPIARVSPSGENARDPHTPPSSIFSFPVATSHNFTVLLGVLPSAENARLDVARVLPSGENAMDNALIG